MERKLYTAVRHRTKKTKVPPLGTTIESATEIDTITQRLLLYSYVSISGSY